MPAITCLLTFSIHISHDIGSADFDVVVGRNLGEIGRMRRGEWRGYMKGGRGDESREGVEARDEMGRGRKRNYNSASNYML